MRELTKNGLKGTSGMVKMIYVLNMVVITQLCICSNSQNCVPKSGKILMLMNYTSMNLTFKKKRMETTIALAESV